MERPRAPGARPASAARAAAGGDHLVPGPRRRPRPPGPVRSSPGPGQEQFGDGVHGRRPSSSIARSGGPGQGPCGRLPAVSVNIGTRCIFAGKMVRSATSERSIRHGVRDLQRRQPACPSTARQHGAAAEHDRIMDELAYIRAADRAGLQVLVVLRAPLPHRLLPPVGQRVLHGLRRRPDQEHPPGLGHLQPHARRPTTPPGSPSGWPCSTTCPRVASSSAPAGDRRPPSRRASASTTRSSPARWWPRRCPRSCACGRRRTTPTTGKFFSMPDAQRAPQALHQPPPAPVGGGRQPRAPSSSPPARASACCASPSASPRASPRSSRSTRRRSRTPSPSATTSTTTS